MPLPDGRYERIQRDAQQKIIMSKLILNGRGDTPHDSDITLKELTKQLGPRLGNVGRIGHCAPVIVKLLKPTIQPVFHHTKQWIVAKANCFIAIPIQQLSQCHIIVV